MGHDDGDARAMIDHEPAEEPAGSRLVPAFLLGLLAGIVVLGLVWMIVWAAGSTAEVESAPSQARLPGLASGSPSASASPAGPTRMERCASAAAALRVPLSAADPAMAQWEVHVGAMNKLVVGAITIQQANAFWNQTRVGAHRQIDRFHKGLAMLRRHGVDCPAPGLMSHTSPALRACARQVAADVQALQAARTSVSTWNMHVREMEMLRMGMISPAKASKMWLSMWQRGVRQLERYHVAERAVHRAQGCPSSDVPDGELPAQPELPSMEMDMG